MSEPMSFIDGSRLIVEACARAGADVFVGYPITPANLLYLYSSRRFPMVLPASDEITSLQWMSGLAATGHLPVTATSFPGYALMLESINMAFMMELPMLIILAQRLGPATGTATCGSQGDLLLVHGQISGGFPVPTFCISSTQDCWDLPVQALKTAVNLRTPVVLLTSKELVMTQSSFDLTALKPISPIPRPQHLGETPFVPYAPDERGVPEFLPLGNPKHQVRLTASTHDKNGVIQNTSAEALGNTRRLYDKIVGNSDDYTLFEHTHESDDVLLVGFDISATACRRACIHLRAEGKTASLLIIKTLFPVSPQILDIMNRYPRVIIVEENLTGQYREILFGCNGRTGVSGVNAMGNLISPQDIMQEVYS
jgi:2-oxoglutarate ferredoxin oxidoreductase subunit alpha